MKPDKHHIDDFFRDNLSDFAKEPAGSSWKKISARLLWYEIAHFRFGNVPKFWYGIAAAGVIGISLLFTIAISENTSENPAITGNQQELFPENPTPTDPSISPDTPVVSPNDISATGGKATDEKVLRNEELPVTEPVDNGGSRDDLTTVVETETQEFKANLSDTDSEARPNHTQPETDAIVQAADIASNKEPEAKNTQKPAEQPTDEAVSENIVVGLTTPDDKNPTGTQSSGNISPINEAKTADITTEAITQPELSPKVIEPDAAVEEMDFANDISAMDPVTEGEITAMNISEPLLLTMKPGLIYLEKAVENDETIPTTRPSAIMLRSQAQSLGKVQKHNARNSLFSSLFRGEYKPPKRSFQDPILAMYGGAKPYFTLSAYFSPEVTEYQRLASESRESSYYGGLALSYNTARFILQAGIEYSTFRDLGDYMVNMSTYDSVGFYHDVVGFEIDPNNPDSIIFETHTVAVWDSVQHHSHQQTNNRYTYLQVPLMIGYKAMQRGLFSAHIKAGPSFSFILNRKEPNLNFQMPGATINGIDNYTAPRLNTNIQLLVSVALQLQFTEKFGLLVEPTYRYYVNPVYDINSEALKNPYGISIKTDNQTRRATCAGKRSTDARICSSRTRESFALRLAGTRFTRRLARGVRIRSWQEKTIRRGAGGAISSRRKGIG